MIARKIYPLLLLLSLVVAGCGGADTGVIETVEPVRADGIASDPGVVLLDIRTPEEFTEARLEGAVNIDFYAPDFADQLAALDRDATYVVYCRSGNRSGQAMALFRDLEFASIHEIGGGIVAWSAAGLPTVSG